MSLTAERLTTHSILVGYPPLPRFGNRRARPTDDGKILQARRTKQSLEHRPDRAGPTQPLLLNRSTDPHLVYVSTYFYVDTIQSGSWPGF
jgi:hypothetical protein